MLIIRLQRTGKKNAADFRVVLAQKTASAVKKFVEDLGSYNPRKKAFIIKSEERLKYWLAQQVEISPTVHNLLVSNKFLDAKKVKAFKTPKKPVEAVAPTTPPASAGTPPSEGGDTAAAPVEAPAVPVESAPVEAPVPAEAPKPAEEKSPEAAA